MCVRRAHEVDKTHLVPLDVVEEDPFPLDEPLVLFARNVLPDEAGLRLTILDDTWRDAVPAALRYRFHVESP